MVKNKGLGMKIHRVLTVSSLLSIKTLIPKKYKEKVKHINAGVINFHINLQ